MNNEQLFGYSIDYVLVYEVSKHDKASGIETDGQRRASFFQEMEMLGIEIEQVCAYCTYTCIFPVSYFELRNAEYGHATFRKHYTLRQTTFTVGYYQRLG